MKRRYEYYLRDILTAIAVLQKVVACSSRERFDADVTIFDTAVFELYKIGEAATQLPVELKATHPEIEWRSIQDYRNLVAHRYWQLERARVWDIVQNKLGPLRKQVAQILA